MKNSMRNKVIELLKLLCDSVLPVVFWVSLIFGFDAPYVAVLTVISAIIHECGHYAAIYILSGRTNAPRGHSTGFRIKRTEALSYGKEIMIILAGPAVNIILFLILLPFGNSLSGYIRLFAFISLATGVSNLIPIEGYDGYGALKELFFAKDLHLCVKGLEAISFFISVLITFISLHMIDAIGEGYWIFGLFFFSMISKIANFGKYDIFEE